ncbi:MAG: hypothetical protein IT162_00585 [Bryobacterales bacterium]|nr:hypothetical protein [Bryobacterales bacterium]
MLLTAVLAAASSVALVTIADSGGNLTASVAPGHGGELSSLRVRLRGGQWVETLYRAEDYSATTGWTGRAPWLWPATGKGDPLPIHGFARDLPWRVVSRGKDRVRVALDSSPRTEALHYPYGFHLEAEYRATGGKLLVTFTVTASRTNTGPMPFSAGNHITFRTPLLPGTDPLAMTLETPSTIEYLKVNRVPTGETRARSLAAPTPVGQLPRLDAVSLGGYAGGAAGEAWMILRDPGGLGIRIAHRASAGPESGPVVRFNVWGDPAGGYFSPEPWVGQQNAHQSKQGLTWLKPGERWEWRMEIVPLLVP